MTKQKDPIILAKEIAQDLIENPEVRNLAEALGILECTLQMLCDIDSLMCFALSELIAEKIRSLNWSVSQAIGVIEIAKQFLLQPIFKEINKDK